MNTYSLILAGGGGTRFWPVSRKDLPKQYLNLSGNNSLINETILRQSKVIPFDNTYIITEKKQVKPLVETIINDVPEDNIIVESTSRNTAPCILYAAMKIYKRCGDGVLCVFPSDHYIKEEMSFRNVVCSAIKLAETTDKIITLGIKPTYPSTGYGYIKYDESKNIDNGYEVINFTEKPNHELACAFINDGRYLWNSGTFICKLSVLLSNYQRFLPRMYNQLSSLKEYFWNKEEEQKLDEVYSELNNISIDYGILERSSDIYVIPGDFGWNDIGSWNSLGAIYPTDKNGNIVNADHISVDSHDCIIYGNKNLIATIGLSDMIVVSVDDATLVCPKNRAQDVKQIVELLIRNGRIDIL